MLGCVVRVVSDEHLRLH